MLTMVRFAIAQLDVGFLHPALVDGLTRVEPQVAVGVFLDATKRRQGARDGAVFRRTAYQRTPARGSCPVHELLERLGVLHHAHVEQHLVPEAGVQEMQHGVLVAANVQVDGIQAS